MMERIVPTGTILQFGGKPEENNDPPGFLFLLPGGREVSRETYANLFSVIGTTFGAGDGKTTFKLPDLAGRFPLGYDANLEVGSVGGKNHEMLSQNNLPNAILKVGINAGSSPLAANQGTNKAMRLPFTYDGIDEHYFQAPLGGKNVAHNNMPPYLALVYIIKF